MSTVGERRESAWLTGKSHKLFPCVTLEWEDHRCEISMAQMTPRPDCHRRDAQHLSLL